MFLKGEVEGCLRGIIDRGTAGKRPVSGTARCLAVDYNSNRYRGRYRSRYRPGNGHVVDGYRRYRAPERLTPTRDSTSAKTYFNMNQRLYE